MPHCIILVQPEGKPTRTYYDHPSLPQALDYLISIYENELRRLNPKMRNFSYDIADLNKFLNSYTDLACMMFNNKTQQYVPHDRKWINDQIFQRAREPYPSPLERVGGSRRQWKW